MLGNYRKNFRGFFCFRYFRSQQPNSKSEIVCEKLQGHVRTRLKDVLVRTYTNSQNRIYYLGYERSHPQGKNEIMKQCSILTKMNKK